MIRRERNEHSIFSHLATDIVHTIFAFALDLDRIHDPDLPLDRLGDHRHQLERMRLVSSTWNNFLLSSSRYWQVIDVTLPAQAITLAIERSGSIPLCVYSGGSVASPLHLLPAARVQTLRTHTNDGDTYSLHRRFLQNPVPVLQTLELHASPWMEDDSSEPLGNLPSIRHLSAKWWEPPADAVWLRDLKELVLWRYQKSIMELLHVLSACASLEQLEIYSMDEVLVEGERPGAIPSVTLPRLRSIRVYLKLDKSVVTLIRRIIAPQCLHRTLRVERVLHLGLHVADYRRFMSLEDKGIGQHPKSAAVRVEGSWFGTHMEYQTETCTINLGGLSAREVPAFHSLVQESQKTLKGPSLTLTIKSPSKSTWLLFKSLGNQNVQTIAAHPTPSSNTGDLLEAIGAGPPDLPSLDGPMANTTADRPFKSLRFIYIHDTRVELVDFTRKVEEYLHKDFKPLLEEIVFVNCRFEGMELAQAAERLAEIGIALQATERRGG